MRDEDRWEEERRRELDGDLGIDPRDSDTVPGQYRSDITNDELRKVAKHDQAYATDLALERDYIRRRMGGFED